MVVTGHIRNGRVELDDDVNVPEGTRVEVTIPMPTSTQEAIGEEIPSLLQRLKPIVGIAKGLPSDASDNVDHYLYGHPKH